MSQDQVYEWLEKNRLRLPTFKNFESCADTIAYEVYGDDYPSKIEIERLIKVIKSYKTRCIVCKGSTGTYTFIGVKPGDKPKFIPCDTCKGSGRV